MREFKGNSTIALPNDYVIIDTETTGLDFEFCDLIEVAAIKYVNGVEVGTFSSLVKPPENTTYFPLRPEGKRVVTRYVDEFIEDLTGITNEMLENSPEPSEVLPLFVDFIGDSVLIGHNVNFDINFLYDATKMALNKHLINDFIDTLRISRKVFPELQHHRLIDVAAACGAVRPELHRALDDCYTTATCYEYMKRLILGKMVERDFVSLFKTKTYERYIKDICIDNVEVDESSPVFGATVVFTGTLTRMPRKQAFEVVAKVGGIPSNSITKETNFLVIGDAEFVSSVKDGKTNKMKKVEELALKGQDIRAISEKSFFELLNI